MKKFLLMLMAAFMAVNVMSAQIDTVRVNPDKGLLMELVVDTVEYPVLKGLESDVKWYRNTIKITPKEFGGKYYVDVEEPTNAIDGGFYWYELIANVATRAGEIDIKDTLNYIHILQTPIIKTFFVNDDKETTVYEGDTVVVSVGVADTLDFDILALMNDEDIVALSEDLTFKFVPELLGKNKYTVVVANDFAESDVVKNPRVITVVPAVVVESLEYNAQFNGKGHNDTAEALEMDVAVTNHDSVTLIVNTNIVDIEALGESVKFVWNFNGKDLPKGVDVTAGDTLTISEYDKDLMDGVYNCQILFGDNVTTATFNIESEWATGVEDIDLNEYGIVCHDGVLVLDNVLNARIAVYNMLGTQLTTTVANSNHMELVVPRNVVLIVTINDTPIKVLSK